MTRNSPESWKHGTRCMKWSRNAKLGIHNGLQLYKACTIWTWSMKTEARQLWDKHFYSLWHGQTASKDRAKMAYKNGPKHEIMKQLTAAVPKHVRALQQHWRGAQNMHIYSSWQPRNQYTNMIEIQCKMRLKSGYNTKYAKYSTNSQRPLMKHEEWAKIRLFLVL